MIHDSVMMMNGFIKQAQMLEELHQRLVTFKEQFREKVK